MSSYPATPLLRTAPPWLATSDRDAESWELLTAGFLAATKADDGLSTWLFTRLVHRHTLHIVLGLRRRVDERRLFEMNNTEPTHKARKL